MNALTRTELQIIDLFNIPARNLVLATVNIISGELTYGMLFSASGIIGIWQYLGHPHVNFDSGANPKREKTFIALQPVGVTEKLYRDSYLVEVDTFTEKSYPAFDYDEVYDKQSTEQLIQQMEKHSPVVRGLSLAALARRYSNDPNLLPRLIGWITEERNRNAQARLMGMITVAHVGFAVLSRYGSPESQKVLEEIYATWEEPDRSELASFLKLFHFRE